MIEPVIIQYLTENMDVPVLAEVPEVPSQDYPDFPEELIVIEKVGGSESNFLSRSDIAIQSYSTSLAGAAALDEQMRQTMRGIVALPEIGGIRLSSNYNHTDVSTKRYRYQSVYTITHY